MPYNPAALGPIKTVIRSMAAAFPEAVIQLVWEKDRLIVVTYPVICRDEHFYAHQIHITIPVAAPGGKFCLHWYSEPEHLVFPENSWILGPRLLPGGEGFRNPKTDNTVYRKTEHIMAVSHTDRNALQGWIARTRYHIGVGRDYPAWLGLQYETDPEAVRLCWQRGQMGTYPDICLDRMPGVFVLRPGDEGSPILTSGPDF